MALVKANSEALLGAGFKGLVSGKFSIAKEVKKGLLRERFFIFGLVFCLLSISLELALVIFFSKKLPSEIPIYYSRPWGEQMLASYKHLFIIPSLNLAFVVLNFFLAFLNSENKFLTRVLLGFSCAVSFGSFWSIVKIITLLV